MRRPDPAHTLLFLGLLRQQRMHGYQLHEFIDRDLASCTDMKRPTAYLLLDRLTQAGWIARRTERRGRRPPRQVYRLTPAGETEFQRLLRANLSDHAATRFRDDIGLAFIDALPVREAATLLDQRRGRVAARLDAARAVAHPDSGQLVMDHLIHHLTAELAWLDRLLKRLRARRAPASGRARAATPSTPVRSAKELTS
ncbi:MAG TPA: PadR family transcriptional regulator [Vicinamibacterales bacterium]|nr:PadR family transcriptional regulator [Vicinamibacterales bacterium]